MPSPSILVNKCLGLRRRSGIGAGDWDRLSAGNLSFSQFINTLDRTDNQEDNTGEEKEGHGSLQGLAWNRNSIWLTSSGLNVADHILPSVYAVLQQAVAENNNIRSSELSSS